MIYDTVTAGQLKALLKDMPDDTEILYNDNLSQFATTMPVTQLRIVGAEDGQNVAVLSVDGNQAEEVLEENDDVWSPLNGEDEMDDDD